ncbi:aldolase/citrate lyase family protein, partial [[Kitasatospora] papulosa]|uniref:aldolase/citrate lyase family protein n=1 Tax=[Kitasatospora] papulosa TaxID=1464011 RepID=UPI0036AE515A
MSPVPLTWLYVPGDRPEVVRKALGSGADVVIVDLEDAVAPDRKGYARAATVELLSDPVAADPVAVPVHVRVHGEDDVKALHGLPGLSGMRLPKITHAASVHHVAALAPGVPLYPLLESARGGGGARAAPRGPPRAGGGGRGGGGAPRAA